MTITQPAVAYKILTKPVWDSWSSEPSQTFTGHGIDISDGFIHLSPSSEVLRTLEQFFSNVPVEEIVLVEINLSKVKDEVKWESVSMRNGVEFPHIYGNTGVGMDAVSGVWIGNEASEKAKSLP